MKMVSKKKKTTTRSRTATSRAILSPFQGAMAPCLEGCNTDSSDCGAGEVLGDEYLNIPCHRL